MNPERLRLFIAVSVPGEVKERIVAAQNELKKVAGQGVRWTSPEQFHLTLRFLGGVEVEQVEALTAALRDACKGFGALKLQASKIGFFPRPRSPRVIWVGVDEEEQNRLPQLYRQIQAVTNSFTKEAPEDRFKGHITLGRVKNIGRKEAEHLAACAAELSGCAGRDEAIAALPGKVFGSWTGREVELMRSQLSPKGAVYSEVASVPLD